MIVKKKEDELLDELLESVDLSTYGIERVHLNQRLSLDPDESTLEPANANPRGAHDGIDKAELEDIIRDFNDRWFANWEATPEDKRQFFFTFTDKVQQHPDFKEKYQNNNDPYTKELAYSKITDDVAMDMRKVQIEFGKQWLDPNFKNDFKNSTQRYLGR